MKNGEDNCDDSEAPNSKERQNRNKGNVRNGEGNDSNSESRNTKEKRNRNKGDDSNSESRNSKEKQNRNKGNTRNGAEGNHEKSESRNSKDKQNRNKLPEIKFESYITEEECYEGLKSSELITGALRINIKRYQDAYIDGGKGSRDVHIEGVEMRNRALPGDVVAVQLLPQDKWKKDANSTEDGEDSYFAKTGKVVYIMQQKHSRVAAGYLNPYRNHQFGFALMSPVDNRLPRLMIPIRECPPDFKTRPKDCEKTIFVAKISSWDLNRPFASATLLRSLGEAGHIEPETEAIIMQNEIDCSDFKEEVINCLPNGKTWKVTAEELTKRKDLRNECIFTIDPATARDLDDALSCKRIGEGIFEVGVHIADVSHFIDEGNALDEVAKDRATSVYMAQRVIPMLPRILCEQLCSLNPGVERLAYSVIWNIKSDGTIVREWFGRSVIRSCVKLSYEHAQQMIVTADNELVAENYPPITGNFPLNKISGVVKDLYNLSVHLRKKRFDSGALRIDQPKISFTLDSESGLPNGCRVYEYKDSNKLIEEFMLLANMAVGRKILQARPNEAILRRHPPPNEMMMGDLDELCKAYGIHFDTRDSASINASLHKTMELDPEIRQYVNSALTLMCAKPFQNAVYFCTGSIKDVSAYRHYALNVPIYTHFTSPIRRYPDVLVHRLLTASLDKGFKVNDDVKELQAIADHCNDKKWAAKDASEQSSQLFFAVYVKECGPLTERGVVVGILDKAIDVLSVRLGMVTRVYCDQLALCKHEHRKDGVQTHMTLYWQDCSATKKGTLDERLAAITKQFEQRWLNKKDGKDGVGEEEAESTKNDNKIPEGVKNDEDVEGAIKQELTIFSPVDIILSVKESAPTKILAHLVNPHDNVEHPEHGL